MYGLLHCIRSGFQCEAVQYRTDESADETDGAGQRDGEKVCRGCAAFDFYAS